MRHKLVELLRTRGRIRQVDPSIMASVRPYVIKTIREKNGMPVRRHPLGFIVLSEPIGKHINLRYHIWPPGWTLPKGQETGETHDHSYELNSLVVAGALRQLTFETTIDPFGENEILEVDYTARASKLRPIGSRAGLKAETDEIFEAGTTYRLPVGTVHRVEVLQLPTITVALTISSPNAPPPRVFVPFGQKAPAEFVRDTLSEEEFAELTRSLPVP